MSKQYYAVQRTGEKKNELTHWKYIKREKRPNGKWRYYYDKKALKDDIKDKLGYDEREALEKTSKIYDAESKKFASMQDKANEYNNRIYTLAMENGNYDEHYQAILNEDDIKYRDELFKSADRQMKRAVLLVPVTKPVTRLLHSTKLH